MAQFQHTILLSLTALTFFAISCTQDDQKEPDFQKNRPGPKSSGEETTKGPSSDGSIQEFPDETEEQETGVSKPVDSDQLQSEVAPPAKTEFEILKENGTALADKIMSQWGIEIRHTFSLGMLSRVALADAFGQARVSNLLPDEDQQYAFLLKFDDFLNAHSEDVLLLPQSIDLGRSITFFDQAELKNYLYLTKPPMHSLVVDVTHIDQSISFIEELLAKRISLVHTVNEVMARLNTNIVVENSVAFEFEFVEATLNKLTTHLAEDGFFLPKTIRLMAGSGYSDDRQELIVSYERNLDELSQDLQSYSLLKKEEYLRSILRVRVEFSYDETGVYGLPSLESDKSGILEKRKDATVLSLFKDLHKTQFDGSRPYLNVLLTLKDGEVAYSIFENKNEEAKPEVKSEKSFQDTLSRLSQDLESYKVKKD